MDFISIYNNFSLKGEDELFSSEQWIILSGFRASTSVNFDFKIEEKLWIILLLT